MCIRDSYNSLFSYSLDTGEDSPYISDADSGNFLQIDQGTAATVNLGDDGIETNEEDGAVPPAGIRAHLTVDGRVGYGIQFDAMDFNEVSGLLRGERLIACLLYTS